MDKDFEKWLQVANELNTVKKNKNTLDYTLFTENGDYGGKSSEVERVFISANTLDEIAPNKVFTALLNAGFDGVIYTPYQPQGFNQYTEFSKSYITFNPTQIKSAEKEKLQERVKGTIDGYVKATLENGAYDYYIEKMIDQMKQQNPQD